jgi:hypothetical protein
LCPKLGGAGMTRRKTAKVPLLYSIDSATPWLRLLTRM